MKRCPTCQEIFADDLNFCRNDGTALIPEGATGDRETMILPAKRNSDSIQSGVLPRDSGPAVTTSSLSTHWQKLPIRTSLAA